MKTQKLILQKEEIVNLNDVQMNVMSGKGQTYPTITTSTEKYTYSIATSIELTVDVVTAASVDCIRQSDMIVVDRHGEVSYKDSKSPDCQDGQTNPIAGCFATEQVLICVSDNCPGGN